jgi:transcriptional regulator GlxA family with amidase domain
MKADVFENEFLQSQLIDYLHQVDGDKIDLSGGMSVMLMLAVILREHGELSYGAIGRSMEQLAAQIKGFELH